MKAKIFTFVRGLMNGTPPRFQSYLKSLILLGFLTIGINQVWGAEGSTHDFSQSLSQLLNNNASISDINIAEQSYTIKEVIISYKTTQSASKVNIACSVGGTSWGNKDITSNTTTTMSFSGTAMKGAVSLSFTNKSGSGTGKGTLTVSKVTLVEGAPASPVTSLILSEAGSLSDNLKGTYKVGDKYTLPSKTDATCGDKTFVGWSTETVDSPTKPTSNFYEPGEEVTLAADNTFYAVFADKTPGGTAYTKVSNNTFSTTDTYVLAAEESGSSTTLHYFSSYTSTTANESWGVTSTDASNAITFTLSGTADALVAKDASGNYLQALATGKFRMSSSSTTLTYKDDGTIYNPTSGSTGYNLRYNHNNGSGGFRWYNGTTGTSAYFYKKGVGYTYSNYTTTCCTKHEVKKGTMAIGGFTATPAQACADVEITLVPEEVTGYNFTGWTSSPNVTITDNKFSMPDEDVTITANYEAISYQITYNLDDGAWVDESQVAKTYTYGTGATLPTADNITKANNTFLGWYVTNPAEIVTSIGATETGDKSFIASWLPNGARDVAYSGDEQLNYISNPQIVDKEDLSLTVTYSVNKGYTISAVAVTVNDAALTAGEVVFNDEQLTITPTAGFTGNVSITFTVVEKMFTVTWMANKAQFKQEQIQEGSKVVLPTGTLPSDVVVSADETYKFQGWITDEQYSSETIAPDYIEDNTIEPTGDVTYYAVYATKESGVVANSYIKGAKTDLTEGQKVIIVNGNSKKALSSEDFSNSQTNYRKAIGVTITNNKISNTNANIVWTVSLENSKYIFKQGTNYLNSTGNNLYCNGNKDTWTITAVSGNAGYTLLSTGGSKYLEYYSDYTEFTCYTGGSGNAFNMDFYIPETTETIKNYRTRVAIIDHIAVHGTPVTTNFVAGETFNATGLTIDVYYQGEDNPTNVTSGFTFAPTGALKTTDENITFSYQGKQVLLPISVSNTVSKIEVTTDPTKMEYTEGQQFDPAGMVVTATYDNSAERDVTGYTYTPTGDLALSDKITISFGGQTTELKDIKINAATKTTVNWFVNGDPYTAGEPSTAVIPGKKITVLPTEPDACQGNQFMGWTTDDDYYNATTAPTDMFKTLAEVPTIGSETTNFYAVFAQVTSSPIAESTVYTSNISEITGKKVKIADTEYDAIQLGTSGTHVGTKNITVPAGTTTLTLHAASWNNSSDVTLTASTDVAGVTIIPATAVDLVENTGLSSNSPWTITPDNTNEFFTFTLSGVKEATSIKFENNNEERVVIWGVNASTTITSDYSTTCLAALAAPTIITAEGEYCGSVDVEITQPNTNPEGAKIMYSTDNETWNEYTAAVKLEASGTIYAKVVKEPKQTDVVSATYTIYPEYNLTQAATAASATSQIACLTFTDLLVQARSQSEVFLKASDGQIVLLNKSSHGLSVGDKLVANDAHVTFVKAHDLLQLTSTEGIAAATTGNATTPEEKAITALAAADYGQLVKIMNVTYDATNKKFTDASSNEIAVDAKFFPSGIPSSWPDGGKFNVTGIVLTNGENVVIAPRNTDDLESLATPLDAPTNFAVASVNSYRASYTWTAVENNAGYTLYIYDGETEIYKSTTIGKTRTDYAPIKDLEAGHAYTAKLVALGDKAEHSDSPAAEVGFTTNPNAKLNWYVGGSFYQTTDASQEKVVTPEIDPTSPCATNYENFVTWYTEEIVSETGQITALDAAKKVKAGDAAASQVGSAKEYNFYAVFGKIKTQGTDKYVAVTEAQDNWKGEYLIGYDEENDEATSIKVFDGSLTTLDAKNNYQTVLFEDDGSIKATETINGYRFIFTKSATTKDAEENDVVYYNIQSASGYYIGDPSGKDNGILTSETTKYNQYVLWDATYNKGVEISGESRYLSFNTASDQMRFRYMSSDKGNLILYKRITTNPQYSGYITTCPQTYTITIAENTKGLVEAATTTEILKGAKVLLTAEAAAGYTKTGGNWIVKNTATEEVVDGLVGNTNHLTMPDYDVTIDYNFVANRDVFVDLLHQNEKQYAEGSVAAGEYVLPELENTEEGSGCDAYYIFDGWVTEEIFSDAPAQNDDMKVNPTYAEGNTYYALWFGEGGFITTCCATPAPENLKALSTYLKATSAKLDWDNVTDATKYHIIVKQGETTLYDTDVEKSEFEITSGLTKETAYDVYVKAYAGCWSENAHIQFTTAAEIKSYSVTINAEGGTYELLADPEMEGNKIQEGAYVVIGSIAVTDPDHYFFKELTIEPEVSDLEESEGTYSFTMPSKAITINIVFAEYPKVTWKMEGAADQTSIAVRNDDKFEIGADNMQSAPENWKYKTYFPEFAGWVTADKCDAEGNVTTAEFITAATEVPADGLTVYGAVAKSASADMSNATKVTSNANLDMTAHYVIGGEKNSTAYYFSDYESVDTQLSWGQVTTDVTIVAPLVFTLSGTADELAIQDNRGNYLVEPSKNKTITMSSTKGTVSLDATGNIKSGTSYYFRLNTNSGSTGVRWYNEQTVEQTYLYKVGVIYNNLTIDPQPDYARTDLVVGNYGTVCVPYTVKTTDRSGATFWNIETSNTPGYTNPTSVTIVQEEGDLVAGKPYIFCATETEMAMFFSGDIYDGSAYGADYPHYNGLYGNLTDVVYTINKTEYVPGYFFVLQQKLYECGTNCTVAPNRGWVQADQIGSEPVEAPVSAPRRVIGNPNGTPTGINNLNTDGLMNIQGARKYFHNNNIVIVNEGRIYNAQGILIQ